MLPFTFVLLSLVLTLIQNKYSSDKQKLSQLLQQSHRNRFSHSVSASMLLTLGRLLFAQLQISLYEISCNLRVNYFLIQISYVSHTPFLSFESNSLSVTAVQECCVKESLSQSQYCGNSVFSQSQVISANQHIFILILWSRICF